jgi:hypothetical protein
MSKKRAIVSYENLSMDQKKALIKDFPAGISEGMSQVKLPTGVTIEALLWETDEIIYLVKFSKTPAAPVKGKKAISAEDDDDDFAVDGLKDDDMKDDMDDDQDDDDDDYDKADEDDEDDEEDDK